MLQREKVNQYLIEDRFIVVLLLIKVICWLLICKLNFQGTYVEGIKEEVVLSPGHALSFIAAGEGTFRKLYMHVNV